MTYLPADIWSLIIVMVATSDDGARDIVRISATSKEFEKLAKQSRVLKVVKFQTLTFTPDYTKHRNPKGLLTRCARYGNPDALSILGKAILHDDLNFWDIVWSIDEPVRFENGSLINPLLPSTLVVKSFILNGSSEDISKVYRPLRNYMILYGGLKEYRALSTPSHNTSRAIKNMCSYEQTRFGIITFFTELAKKLNRSPLNEFLAEVMPRHKLAHRKEVAVIFEKLFPAHRY